jgi:hypothetical protein
VIFLGVPEIQMIIGRINHDFIIILLFKGLSIIFEENAEKYQSKKKKVIEREAKKLTEW